ncbi:MAG: GNAT family N-acetyltransferase [Pyrinomonadaceae bacterium]
MFETTRLILRPFEDADVDAIAVMRADPKFMRYIKSTETRKQSVSWMQLVSRYWQTDNYGFWAVVLKELNVTIGWSGTWNLPDTKEKEIGFAIAPPFWGRGLATEAATVALLYSFENRCGSKTVAVARPENSASRRVMEKLGMKFEDERYFKSYGLKLVYYSVTKEEYARNGKIALSQTNLG